MLRRRLLHFCFALLVCAPAASAQGRVDCNAITSHILRQAVPYCVLLPAGYDTSPARHYPVLYFLHGLGENEQALFTTGGWNVVQDLQQKHEISDFLVVTPQARASFYINSVDGKVRYGDFFLQEFLPSIETKYRVQRQRGARAIGGISMGGYGAFRFALSHPELFSAVSAESAALMTPSAQEINSAMQSGTQLGRLLGPVFGNPVNVAHWQENNPLVLARRKTSALARLAIYFNCGKDDEFGFEHGAQEMDKQLDAQGIKHEFHLYPGNHGMEYFLAHLGEVMKFHSQHFAAGR